MNIIQQIKTNMEVNKDKCLSKSTLIRHYYSNTYRNQNASTIFMLKFNSLLASLTPSRTQKRYL